MLKKYILLICIIFSNDTNIPKPCSNCEYDINWVLKEEVGPWHFNFENYFETEGECIEERDKKCK